MTETHGVPLRRLGTDSLVANVCVSMSPITISSHSDTPIDGRRRARIVCDPTRNDGPEPRQLRQRPGGRDVER
jgi:hypothetical protein